MLINWYYPCSFLTRILNTSPGHVPIEINVLKRVITYFCILNMLAPVSARDGRDKEARDRMLGYAKFQFTRP